MSGTGRERIERSTSRFSGVTRIGLRVVVVAGFAGAAWAMSASGAHAAAGQNHSAAASRPIPSTAPLTSLVTDLGGSTLNTLLGTSPSARPSSGSVTDTVVAPLGDALGRTAKPLADAGSSVLTQVLAPTNTVLPSGGTGAAASVTKQSSRTPLRHTPDVALGAATHESGSGAVRRAPRRCRQRCRRRRVIKPGKDSHRTRRSTRSRPARASAAGRDQSDDWHGRSAHRSAI